MHPYLPHLLKDIESAHHEKSLKTHETTSEEDFERRIKEVEQFVSGDNVQTFGYYSGLEPEIFPMEDQFSKQEKQAVCNALIKMFGSWNLHLAIPENVPLDFRYKLMVQIFKVPYTPITAGFVVHDFCSGYAPACDLEKYCPCLEHWNEK